MEIKIRNLMLELVGPTITRQQEFEKMSNNLFTMSHKFDTRLRDCQIGLKKQMNIREELDKINTRIEGNDAASRNLDTKIQCFETKLEGKIEKISA
mmetsp:Transcript_27760/g.34499  ORF Transcript_27760/g.34499 Transcript_27760/m.34499 type:complete len:96 (-) Transcript_27760:794-1081(-)